MQEENPRPRTRAAGKAARRRAWRKGRRAEGFALFWLRLKGYRLLARGYRTAGGEVDLILRRGRLVVFVEVKRREELAAAAESIGARQRRRIAAAARHFLQRHPGLAGLGQRFDALLLAPGRWPRHVTDAWRDSG
jgi:putative endonuclease